MGVRATLGDDARLAERQHRSEPLRDDRAVRADRARGDERAGLATMPLTHSDAAQAVCRHLIELLLECTGAA